MNILVLFGARRRGNTYTLYQGLKHELKAIDDNITFEEIWAQDIALPF